MIPDRRDFSFWRRLSRLELREFGWLEVLAAVVVGVIGTVLANEFISVDQRVACVGNYQALAGALVGIVFAGFSLIVGLMSDSYSLWLRETPKGLAGFLGPFFIGVGIQISVLLASVAYRVSATVLPHQWEITSFAIVTILFLYAAFDVVVLARLVFAHAVTKAEVAEIEGSEQRKGRDS